MIHKPLIGRHPNGFTAYKMLSSKDERVPISHLGPKDYKIEGDRFVPQKFRLGGYILSPNISNQAFLYRGEAVDLDEYGNVPLKESAYQNDKLNVVDMYYHRMRWYDLRRLLSSNPLYRLLSGSIRLSERDRLRFRISSSMLLHSYGVPSSFVSLTSDLKIALFYAVTDYDAEKRRFVPTTKKYGILSHYKLNTPLALSSRVVPVGLQVFERPGRNKEFVCRLKGEETFYTLPYVDGFLFEQDAELSKRVLADFAFGTDLCPYNDILSNRIAMSEGVFSLSAYKFIDKFYSNYKIDIDTLEKKYRLTNEPSKYFKFSREELGKYYDNIDYWWYEFCKKINFAVAPEIDEQFICNLPYERDYVRFFDQCRI